jgi:hypothetical protein
MKEEILKKKLKKIEFFDNIFNKMAQIKNKFLYFEQQVTCFLEPFYRKMDLCKF